MKIVQITAGAGGRICGSCLHDNALVRALRARGRDAILVPAYVPTTTDEENVAEARIVCGGVNVWLQEHVPLFRHTPWWFDRLLDGRGLLTWLSSRTGETRPAELGGLTVSTLAGEAGHQRKEVEKLARWLAADVKPDVVQLSNALLVGLARRVKEATGAKIVCSLSGEDIFVERIPEPHYGPIRRLLRERSRDVDRFVALNDAFARFMAAYLDVPGQKIAVVPHGVDLAGFPATPPDLAARRAARGGRFVIGSLARLCPEKGLDQSIRALAILVATHDVELVAAGATSPAEAGYLDECRRLAADLGVAGRLKWLGQVDRAGKLRLLERCDVFAMPTAHPEAKGLPVIEALAAGVPVVAPDHGAFPETLGGVAGLLHAPNDPADLARALRAVLDDPARARALGAAGHALIRERHTFATMAAGHEALYAEIM
ncbi:MAG: glycosyltransferase family 1 protein [Planctomycetia bacterium]|nr:glycosyltransferase family 1 protein [Planctomycetia bacterium]